MSARAALIPSRGPPLVDASRDHARYRVIAGLNTRAQCHTLLLQSRRGIDGGLLPEAQALRGGSMTERDALLLAYGEASDALEMPAVRFLARRKHAAFVVAVFRTAFGADASSVQTNVLHLLVEQAQGELGADGLDVPPGSGREVCRGWMRDEWLRRVSADDDADVYVKTAHAEDALTMIERNMRERPQLSESTIATVLHAARQCAIDANPDAQARISRLDEQIAALQAERNRLADGGEIEMPSDARMLERLANLNRLLADLPADFLAAAEAVDEIHRELADAFRADDRPASAVIRDYLDRVDALGDDARAAAFIGASELFRNDAARQGLRDDLDVFLSHPFTRQARPDQLARARGAVLLLQAGVDQVLARRRRASQTLRTRIQQRTDHDGEIRSLLDGIQDRLIELGRSGGRWHSPSDVLPIEASIGHLPTRFHDPNDHKPPPPLYDPDRDEHEGAGLSFELLRRYGGPNYWALHDAIAARLAEDGIVSVAEVFAELDLEMRRPVDLLGLLHLAGAEAPAGELMTHRTVRPDGVEVTLRTTDLLITHLESQP